MDFDKLVNTEILPEMPMKVLCNEECKGICPKCGTDLNEKDCGCDRISADPRMARVLDIF